MIGSPDGKNPGAGGGAKASKRISQYRDDANNSLTTEIPQDCLRRRPMMPSELPHVRRLYWAHAAHGTRLPAERGVIVIDGGRQ
jgi:hypothetical protein